MLYHLAVDSPERWYPILSVYYLTYACRFRCPYCSDGAGRPYYAQRGLVLDGTESLGVLAAIRRHCSYVVLTGGEPLEHPELAQVLHGLPGLGFRGVTFTTNAYELEPALPALAPAVTELVVSLDTLDESKADRWYGVGRGALARILDNIERARRFKPARYEILISTVLTPDNLDDAFEVYRFARERRLRFAACTELQGFKAHPALGADPRYRRFYDQLIADKQRGRPIHGTVRYLERMRELGAFRCRPFTMLVVSPMGEVFYPCLELGKIAGRLREEPNLHRLRQQARDRFGPEPRCEAQCHSACALGFAVALEQPLALAREAVLEAKCAARQHLGR